MSRLKQFFQVKHPDWFSARADVDSAEIVAIVRRSEDDSIDWDASRHLYWNRNPIKHYLWLLRNGKEGKKLLKREQQRQEGG